MFQILIAPLFPGGRHFFGKIIHDVLKGLLVLKDPRPAGVKQGGEGHAHRLLEGLGEAPYFYFANSYYCPAGAHAAALCEYEVEFCAMLESGNVFGVQFHPEKSGPAGLRVMRNFLSLAGAGE